MLSKLIEWILRTMKGLKSERDVILDVQVSDKMKAAIDLWCNMYHGSAPWTGEQVKSMSIPSVLASELSRMTTIELKSELTGTRGDAINPYYQEVLKNIRSYTEWAAAKGGICFKPYVSDNGIEVDVVQADCFLPVDYDSNGDVCGAAFVSRITRGKRYYTRIEWHYFADDLYIIKNKAYLSESKDDLGREIQLASVDEWADVQELTEIRGLKYPLFSYFKMPFANSIDPYSPLGVSVYSRAVDLIEQADKQYSRLLWEFEGGELAVDASVDALQYDDRHKNGRLPNGKERLFRGLDIQNGDKDLYEVFSPTLRDQSLINGLNEILIRIEDACGFARGTISNLDNTSAKTATELKSMKQRTYALVCDTQKALQYALEGLVRGMDELADLYHIAPAGDIKTSFEFDDSVVCDREREFSEKQQLVSSGIMQPWEFRMWYFGEDEATAKKMVEEDPLYEESER